MPATGGIQTWCLELARYLAGHGHDVWVGAPALPSGDQEPSWFEQERFRVERLPCPASWGSWLFAVLPFWLRRQSWRPEVVITAQWPLLQGLLWLDRRIPVINLVHGRELLSGIWGPLTSRIARLFLTRASMHVCNSHAVQSMLQRIQPRVPSCVIHPGVDPQTFFPVSGFADHGPLQQDDWVVLSLGRQVRRKNTRALVRIWPKVLQRYPQARLCIGGGGPELPVLQKLVQQGQLQHSVFFLGRIPDQDLNAWYSRAQVFAMPCLEDSRDVEGFGIVFLEANACETPVIGSRSGGVPDAIAEGISGILVTPDDDQALLEAICKLIEPSPANKILGQQARQRVLDSLTWDHCNAQIEDLCRI